MKEYYSDIGLSITPTEFHRLVKLDCSEVYYNSTEESIFTRIIRPILFLILFFIIKVILCMIAMTGLLYGYFYLVAASGLDMPQYNLLHIMSGLCIAMLTVIFWGILTFWLND